MSKKIIGLMMLAAVVFTSCNKNDGVTNIHNDGSTHQVRMTVSAFAPHYEDMGTLGRSIGAQSGPYVKHVNYALYKKNVSGQYFIVSAGVEEQRAGVDPNFLTYSSELEKGDYKLYVIAGTNELPVFTGDNVEYTYANSLEYGGYSSPEQLELQLAHTGYNQDVFAKEYAFTVTNSDVTLAMNLDRVTSKLVLNLTDTQIPANVKEVYMRVVSPDRIELLTGKPTVDNGQVVGLWPAAGEKIVQSGFVFGADKTGFTTGYSVEIVASFTDATPSIVKTLNNVDAKADHELVITGKLFDGGTDDLETSVPVSIDEEFDKDPIVKPIN